MIGSFCPDRHIGPDLLLDALNRIFETIITPILSYNAEVWGVYNKHDFEHWDNTTTEKAHIRFCKSY